MNYFFGFDVALASNIDWRFNINHLFLALFVILVIVGLLFALNSKTEKGQKITKIVLATLLLVLELGRIIWKICQHIHLYGSIDGFDWWWNISFQMCAIMTWTTIITLYVSAFAKNKNHIIIKILENILLGTAMVGGILTFIYPDLMDGSMPFFHFRNIQTVLTHTLLIFVPIWLVKIGELKIRIKNIWMPALGFLYVGCFAMMMSLYSGQNFAYSLACDLMEDIGLHVPYPWHLLIVVAIIFCLTVLIYAIGEIVYRKKHKTEQKPIKTQKEKYHYASAVTCFVLAAVQGVLMLMLISLGLYTPTDPTSPLAIFCLLPFGFSVLLIKLGMEYLLLSEKEDLSQEVHSKNYIILLVVSFLLNIILGFYQLFVYLKFSKQKKIIKKTP